jgi:hypothetical protein
VDILGGLDASISDKREAYKAVAYDAIWRKANGPWRAWDRSSRIISLYKMLTGFLDMYRDLACLAQSLCVCAHNSPGLWNARYHDGAPRPKRASGNLHSALR